MNTVFAPGCALAIENPGAADRILTLLNQHMGPTQRLDTCCRNSPELSPGTTVINVCAGCDKRYRENYPDCTTISLWEILDKEDFWTFPDHKGAPMSVLDPCPVRTENRVHGAVRSLLEKMNIQVREAERIKNKSICCGDSAWGVLPTEKIIEKMTQRADQMPEEDVVVYCVSCIKSIHNGGKTPHHLVNLLFGQPTTPGTCDPDQWHAELEAYVQAH
ncbi:(Fe-S)-binding protein [Desulfoluna butyratoxydans]|uniref:Cysteine-rich domain n=1 Tax=Desulfoluna butyratoxydans TaxID=231438 RepID=A0A4U8YKR4_9BACT|nr:(Fe-S)-binding protein [Desulfoluna butyratoxydans]VFQ44150.1 hypothetical protein MSL71_17940 [Desulfoluna butyratoxydans]